MPRESHASKAPLKHRAPQTNHRSRYGVYLIASGVESGECEPADPALTTTSFFWTLLQYCIYRFEGFLALKREDGAYYQIEEKNSQIHICLGLGSLG